MWVNITSEDIFESTQANGACPITIALQRQFGNKVSVSRDFIRVPKKNKKNELVLIKLPAKVRNFTLNLSQWHSAGPFKFQLTASDVRKLKANL